MRYLLSNRLPGWISPVRRIPSIETSATGPRVKPSPTRSGSSAIRSAMVKVAVPRSEEHTSELQSLMRISYAVFCLKKKNTRTDILHTHNQEYHTPRLNAEK